MPISYEYLRIIWWLLMGVLLAGFAVLDGFDLGAAISLPFVAKTDQERQTVLATLEPVWESNQVWFILGGGAIFAAWPLLYSVSFSGFYLAMFALLCTFILRPVGFKFRNKLPSIRWRYNWDRVLFACGISACLIFGVAIGNVLQGVPFYFDQSLRVFYTGSFFALFNPFALLCGLISVTMLTMQGTCYLNLKTDGLIQKRALSISRWMSLLLISLFALAGYWVSHILMGFSLAHPLMHDAPSNPLLKDVIQYTGAWMENYQLYPWTRVVPALGFMGALMILLFAKLMRPILSFVFSSLSVIGIVATVGVSMFPFLLPSSSQLKSSLLVWDASSSQMTLTIMFFSACFFMPIIILYVSWVYYILRGKVSIKALSNTGY